MIYFNIESRTEMGGEKNMEEIDGSDNRDRDDDSWRSERKKGKCVNGLSNGRGYRR